MASPSAIHRFFHVSPRFASIDRISISSPGTAKVTGSAHLAEALLTVQPDGKIQILAFVPQFDALVAEGLEARHLLRQRLGHRADQPPRGLVSIMDKAVPCPGIFTRQHVGQTNLRLDISQLRRPGDPCKRRAADKAIKAFKNCIRDLTLRVTGRSLRAVTERLRSFVLGWKAYFRLAQTPRVWRELDEWMRHRLRAIQLKQWRRGRTIFRELTAMGAKSEVAAQIAANGRRWWRNSGMLLNTVLTIKWADQLGMPRLA